MLHRFTKSWNLQQNLGHDDLNCSKPEFEFWIHSRVKKYAPNMQLAECKQNKNLNCKTIWIFALRKKECLMFHEHRNSPRYFGACFYCGNEIQLANTEPIESRNSVNFLEFSTGSIKEQAISCFRSFKNSGTINENRIHTQEIMYYAL